MRDLEFFKSLFASQNDAINEESYFPLCANMKYEFFEMGSFVFLHDDPSNGKFYVILSGEVGVIVPYQVPNIFEKDQGLGDQPSSPTKFSSRSSVSHSSQLSPTKVSTVAQSQVPISFGVIFAAKKATRALKKKAQQKTGEDDKYSEYRQLVQKYGNLARVLSKGDSFGDGGLCYYFYLSL